MLAGWPGMGARTLAIDYAHKFYENTYQLIVWLNNNSQETYEDSLRKFADAWLPEGFNQRIRECKKFEEVEEIIFNYLDSEPFEKPWLLVLDNHKEKCSRLPRTGSILFIVTPNHHVSGAEIVKVEGFSHEESVAYLKHATGEDSSQHVEDLAEKLENIPQLIYLAGKYISSTPGSTIDKYYFALDPLIWDAKYSPIFEKESNYNKNLIQVWLETFQELKRKNPLAADWLEVCSYLKMDDIPLDGIDDWLASKGIKSPQFRQFTKDSILRDLRDLVLDISPNADKLSISRFLQKIIRQQVLDQNKVFNEAKSLVHKKMSSFDWNEPESWAVGSNWHLHAEKITKWNKKMGLKTESKDAEILDSLSMYFLSIGAKDKNGLSLINEAIEILLLEDPNSFKNHLIKFYNDRYVLYSFENSSDKSKNDLEKVLKIINNSDLRFLDNKEVIRTWINFGLFKISAGEHKNGRDYLVKADNLYRSLYGEKESLLKAKILFGLGSSLLPTDPNSGINELVKGVKMYEQQSKGKDGWQFFALVKTVAVQYLKIGDKEKSLKAHLKAQEMFKKIDMGENVHQADILNNLAILQEDHEEALRLYQQALEMYERVYKKEHSDMARTWGNMSERYKQLGNQPKAKEALQNAVRIYLKTKGKDAKETSSMQARLEQLDKSQSCTLL